MSNIKNWKGFNESHKSNNERIWEFTDETKQDHGVELKRIKTN